ncbi:Exosome non-catalytic core component [Microbotryomycetes sp. JL221]|nr:Exosome non-catalytic core component [Microbotryomycetes sp. JL221]
MSSRAQLLTPSNLRTDCRLPLECRQTWFQLGPTTFSDHHRRDDDDMTSRLPSNADGYAIATHGLTKVSSTVFGPREPNRTGAFSSSTTTTTTASNPQDTATLNVQLTIATWADRSKPDSSKRKQLSSRDKRTVELAASIKATFEPVILLHLYPRSTIDIHVHVIEQDGALLQAATNATTLALVSAGIPLTDYVCSLSLASYPFVSPSAPPQIPPFTLTTPSPSNQNQTGSGSTTLIDLTMQEESSLPNVTVAVLPKTQTVTLINLETRISVNRFEELLRWAIQGSQVIHGAMQQAVMEWAQSLAVPNPMIEELFPKLKQTIEEDM